MRKLIVAAATLALSTSLAGSAAAGIYTDDLARCLVRSTSPDDQAVLMRWMFAMFSGSPVVSAMSNVTAEQRTAMDKQAAALFQRLVLVDCRKEAVSALKYEGGAAFEGSFSTLGQVATRGLMTGPQVGAEMKRFGSYVDAKKIAALQTEAGVTAGEAAGVAGK